ncbi:MAG: hypothetical protein ABJP45_06045 [Cyclobacteriaceae bacterium]
MSTNNTFKWSRFKLLFKQAAIHNSKMMLYSSVGFCGVVFMILVLSQLGNDFRPHDTDMFLGSLAGFVAIFGILYSGYSFPAFRNKENTTSYLTVPASTFEKFLFEFSSRIMLMLIVLPFLFWLTFNLEGYVFNLFGGPRFDPVGFSDLIKTPPPEVDIPFWTFTFATAATFLIFVLPFTGAAMFSKQPLVKTLFSIALVIAFFVTYAYIVIEPLGLGDYDVDNSIMWLVPRSESGALKLATFLAVVANLTMLSVAYFKLKEKEV